MITSASPPQGGDGAVRVQIASAVSRWARIKAKLAPGTYMLWAWAEDSDGLFGPAAELTLTVQ